MDEKFGNEVLDRGVSKASGTPRFKITCPDDELELSDVELQKLFDAAVSHKLIKT
jgi:hypothetical protein